MARAQRILETEPEDVVERGYLLVHQLYAHPVAGIFLARRRPPPEVAQAGRRFGDADLVAMGLVSMDRLASTWAGCRRPWRLLDEAMIGFTTAEVSPVFAGIVYCAVIEGCQEIPDYARVAQWTRALTQWCQSQPDLVPFTGQCSVHRAQVMRAARRLRRPRSTSSTAPTSEPRPAGSPGAAVLALAERGDILRIRGRLCRRRERLHPGVDLRP